jgi:glyoxylase-like metal-dependent hydrolase (beta-lactamase superfamily II)
MGCAYGKAQGLGARFAARQGRAAVGVANSVTLIYGKRDGGLVDTFLTIEQSQTLLNWIV